jgi:phycocyanobilin:ferredoxin oxidoreductase
MMTLSIFDKVIACAEKIEEHFKRTGELTEQPIIQGIPISDKIYSSNRYRRAHISIVDARETKKLWLMHVTVFPHYNDASPIYGFDIVAGPNKVSGGFHDFSNSGDPVHPMCRWFANKVAGFDWNKPRELPEWARHIFSNHMVAIGAVDSNELDEFIGIGLESLEFYLATVGDTQQSGSDYHMAQNRYCHYQKQNPHTPKVMLNLGMEKQQVDRFMRDILFPEAV